MNSTAQTECPTCHGAPVGKYPCRTCGSDRCEECLCGGCYAHPGEQCSCEPTEPTEGLEEIDRLRAELVAQRYLTGSSAIDLTYREAELADAREDARRSEERLARVRELLPKWRSERAQYPLGDPCADVAFAAVKLCGQELAAALGEGEW